MLAAVLTWRQWDHYRSVLGLDGAAPLDRGLLLWLVYAITLVSFVPVLGLGWLLLKVSRPRAAAIAFALGATVMCLLIVADLGVHRLTGNRLRHYVQFLTHAHAAEWGGGTGLWSQVGRTLLACTAGVVLTLLLSEWAVRRAPGKFLRPRRTRGWVGLGVVLGVSALGVLAALPAFGDARLLDRAWGELCSDAVQLPGRRDPDLSAFANPFNDALRPVLQRTGARLLAGPPGDDTTRVEPPAGQTPGGGRRLPNVLLVIVESLRADALRPDVMPRLFALSQRGVRLEGHWAGANLSHLGAFSLLYGRPATAYHRTLDARVPPQACTTLHRSGYRTAWVSCGRHRQFMRMDEFIDAPGAFDEVVNEPTENWPPADQEAMDTARQLLARSESPDGAAPPQFVSVFLLSTHIPYLCPPAFATRQPVVGTDYEQLETTRAPERRHLLVNRYLNAVGFVDDMIGRMVDSLDLEKTLVIVTGDHGESLWEDGVISHGGRATDVEMRVPCVMVGAGLPSRAVKQWTTHADVLPTMLGVLAGRPVRPAGCAGRDVLAEGYSCRSVLIGPWFYRRNPWSMVLITPKGRLKLALSADATHADVAGMIAVPGGELDRAAAPPPAEAAEWAALLGEHLDRMAH